MSVVEEIRQQDHALRLQLREPWVILLGQRQARELEGVFLRSLDEVIRQGAAEALEGHGGLDGMKVFGVTIVTVDVPDLLQVKMSPYGRGKTKEV